MGNKAPTGQIVVGIVDVNACVCIKCKSEGSMTDDLVFTCGSCGHVVQIERRVCDICAGIVYMPANVDQIKVAGMGEPRIKKYIGTCCLDKALAYSHRVSRNIEIHTSSDDGEGTKVRVNIPSSGPTGTDIAGFGQFFPAIVDRALDALKPLLDDEDPPLSVLDRIFMRMVGEAMVDAAERGMSMSEFNTIADKYLRIVVVKKD